MKKAPRLTKRERKATSAAQRPAANHTHDHGHIHCIACGKHLDPSDFEPPVRSATVLTCQHGSQFPSCVTCTLTTQRILDEHDRTGQPVKAAGAWH